VRIPGFTGIQPLAANLELIFDTRATRSHLLSGAAPSSGWRLAARGGYQLDFGDNSSRFWRYGADLRRHIDLYRGDRVVVLGAAFDGVAGDITEVPFVDLPTLGGKHRLRGYAGGRFRDRLAAVTSAEYRYPVSRNALGFLAVDAGRVWREPGDIDIDVDDLRVGFGGGLQLHSHRSFVARLSLFTSIDGGIEASVVFDPVVPGRRRTAR
jgi:outer membrane protein assembly factor BamA